MARPFFQPTNQPANQPTDQPTNQPTTDNRQPTTDSRAEPRRSETAADCGRSRRGIRSQSRMRIWARN
eukprot:7279288-Lingulodinium_polyedra.AAC.1